MPADAAEWVREHVWSGRMRETFREVPGFYLACACQYGLTTLCRIGKHDECHRATPLPDNETSVLDSAERQRYFKKPYRHLVRTSATGPQRTRDALVWLADRVCRWLCPCECHLAGKQMDLFALAGDGRG